jgi:GNAT superfamily N-acetyltransferase/RimJ/RimL family protein N-acetyltransferase
VKGLKRFHYRPVDLEKDCAEIAGLISSQEDEPTSAAGFREDYEADKASTIRLITAEDLQGEMLGFTWAYANKVEPERMSFYLVVKPEHRLQGVGRQLYEDLFEAVQGTRVRRIRTTVLDSCPESRAFAERRGFVEIRHQIGMELDLQTFDDRPYDAILARLQGEGFRFTSMAELGNTEAAQRKLYALNDSASASTPGQGGEHPWVSFEDFQKSVCLSAWYMPEGQIVAIDSASGAWAGMSAITRRQGQDYAYNLFTGVDLPYRGRKLGQAVKVLALRHARSSLQAKTVRTHHNTKNLPMIAIDTKFGYRVVSGAYVMERNVEQ